MTSDYVGSFDGQLPIEQRTRIDYSDEGHNKILIMDSCQDVSNTLERTLNVASLDRNAYGRNVDNSGNLLLVYRLKEQLWTVIEPPVFQPVNKHPVLKSHIAKAISASIETDVIFYNYQPYEERFDVYERGEIKEKFSSFRKGELHYQQRTNDIEVEKLRILPRIDLEKYFYFYPDISDKELRAVTSKLKRRTPCALSSHFLSKYKVYIPYIHWFGRIPERTVKLSVDGLRKDDFEDFYALQLTSSLL